MTKRPLLYLTEELEKRIKDFSEKEKLDNFHVAGRKLIRIALEQEAK